MELARDSWTDDRLDDLSHRMDESSCAIRTEMKEGFDRVDKDIREMRAEIGSLHRAMIQFGGAMIAALIGLIATQAGLILTQL